MIPFIIAGAVGFGIAKLLEKDNTKKYAGGGKTGEIKDGDSVIMYFNQDTELEIFESEDLDEEPYIDVFKKGEKFEVDIFGVDDTIYDVQFGDGDVAFIRKNNVTIVSVNDKTFASGGEASMIYLISDNATPKREISISENDLLRESKNFFNWRNVSVKRIKSLGSSDYDKFIEFLHKQGYSKEEFAEGGRLQTSKLVVEETGEEVELPYKTKDFRGDDMVVIGFTEPRSSASEGRIEVEGRLAEYYPSVAGLKIISILPTFSVQNPNKFAGGGKTGEIKDGDSVIMYFNQDTELEIFESEDLDEEPYIDVFKKGEKFEVDIFGVDDTIYDVQFGDGDVAFIRKNNVTIVSVNDKTFASGGEAGEYSEEVEKILENLEPEGVKFEGNSREGFSVLVKDKNSDFSAFVDVYMQGSDVNWEWNQYMFARNNSMDMLQSELQDNIDIADYFSSEAIHYLEQQGAIQQDDNGDWSYTKKYESGGSVSKGYMVFNYTDNLYATYDVFKTKKLANDFIKEFRNRYSKQGYYRDNQMNKIDIKDIDLLAIPSDFNPLK